jgi:hypothetical protein
VFFDLIRAAIFDHQKNKNHEKVFPIFIYLINPDILFPDALSSAFNS